MDDLSIIINIADYHTKLICNKVIRRLQSLKGNNLLSGEGSGLKNVWDEVCVQFQHQFSIYWEAYKETIDNIILKILDKTDIEILKLISYANADESEINGNEDFNSFNDYPYCPDVALSTVNTMLYDRASNYSNKRIEEYIDNSYG